MYCIKCGNELINGAHFCRKCGAKILPANSDGQTTDMDILAVEPTVVNTTVASKITSIASIQNTFQGSFPVNEANDLKVFVDNHVQAITQYQSATDLLQNGKPSKAILLVALPGLLLAIYGFIYGLNTHLLLGIVVFVFFFFICCTYPLRFAAFVRQLVYTKKFIVSCDRRIDTDDFIQFLNNNMKYLSADLGEWVSSQGKDAACIVGKSRLIIMLPSTDADKKQFDFFITTEARGNTTGCMSLLFFPVLLYNLVLEMSDIRTGEFSIFYKAVPVLSGVADYYVKNSKR